MSRLSQCVLALSASSVLERATMTPDEFDLVIRRLIAVGAPKEPLLEWGCAFHWLAIKQNYLGVLSVTTYT